MSKPKVEAIYPLTFMQQTLLMHSLYESNDQGFLQVTCKLEGNLDDSLLRDAWQQCIQRHWALRSSVHWKKIKKPVQIIHPASIMPWTNYDLSGLAGKAQSRKIASLMEEDRLLGFDLSRVPVSRLSLIRLSDNSWQMLWSCHHILLDGWSAGLIIRDVFAFYDALVAGRKSTPEPLPTYTNYLNWLQNQHFDKARLFWQQQFEGFKNPVLIGEKQTGKTGDNEFLSYTFSLPASHTSQLKSLGRQCQVTSGTIIQSCWGLLLTRYGNTQDAVFGTAVSGRNTGMVNMDLMAGMFANVLPARIRWDAHTPVPDWLKKVQAAHSGAQNFEFATLDQITDWTGWPGELPLTDCLLVFENFPWTTLERGGVKVTDLSGGVTSTYPVTVIVIPGDVLRVEIKFRKNQVSSATAKWFCKQFEALLRSLPGRAEDNMADLFNSIEVPPVKKYAADMTKQASTGREVLLSQNGHQRSLITPRNPTELQLAKLWEQLFGRSPIGVTEDFFEMGGTSMLAVKLLALIEQKLKINLPPVALLQNPTIGALAQILNKDRLSPSWSALVPLRTRGSKPPIFCMHAGGGHVYFYHALSKYMDEDQPVYSMQPVGLDGISPYHKSIKTMAADYLKEIRSVQPKGPYALLGTCFSNAVCLEIAHQLRKMGEAISLLVIVDSGGRELGRRVRIPRAKTPVLKRLKRFVGLSFGEARYAISRKATKKIEKLKKKWEILTESAQARKLREMQEHLGRLYEDYFWEPCQEKVTLIRSSEYNEDPNKNFHIERWTAIALGGLSVHVVPGEHLTLFEEPAVEHLARKLQGCLDEARGVAIKMKMEMKIKN